MLLRKSDYVDELIKAITIDKSLQSVKAELETISRALSSTNKAANPGLAPKS